MVPPSLLGGHAAFKIIARAQGPVLIQITFARSDVPKLLVLRWIKVALSLWRSNAH